MSIDADAPELLVTPLDDPPPLGPPAPPPAPARPWSLGFATSQGSRPVATLLRGDEVVHSDRLDVASSASRRRFADEAIKAAARLVPPLAIDPDELVSLLLASAPAACPTPTVAPATGPTIANHSQGRALAVAEIDAQVTALAPGWPKRVGDRLFVATPDGPEPLDSPDRMMSWFDERARVDWAQGSTMISPPRYHHHLARTAERHDAIEVMPHQPPIPGLYYMVRDLPGEAEAAGALDEFVALFHPETPHDRQLIEAMILTPAWGGPNGGRPAFLITSPDGAPNKGTGRGKSRLAQLVAALHGGAVEVDPGASIEGLKTRLLSPAAESRRVLLLDNVKSHRLSWGELEGLITADAISGRRLYAGEGRRPNTLTTLITLNGARLSADLARRVVTVVLGRPTFDAAWDGRVARFLAERRRHVLVDIIATLRREPPTLEARLGFAAWEAAVLAQVADPRGCQELIFGRRAKVDADGDERASVLATFRGNLRDRGLDPDEAHVEIPKAEAARWLSTAERDFYTTAKATIHIRLLAINELAEKHKKDGEYWVWRGERATAEPGRLPSPGPGTSSAVELERRRLRY